MPHSLSQPTQMICSRRPKPPRSKACLRGTTEMFSTRDQSSHSLSHPPTRALRYLLRLQIHKEAIATSRMVVSIRMCSTQHLSPENNNNKRKAGIPYKLLFLQKMIYLKGLTLMCFIQKEWRECSVRIAFRVRSILLQQPRRAPGDIPLMIDP